MHRIQHGVANNEPCLQTELYKKQPYKKGWKNHIRLEGGSADVGAMTYPPFYSMVGGALETSVSERDTYIASVPNTQPDPPTNVSAIVVGTSGATVSFDSPTYTGKSPILTYTVISSPGGIRMSGSASPISISGLNSQYKYTFTVFATNAEGNSPESEPSNEITLQLLPSPPVINYIRPYANSFNTAFIQIYIGDIPPSNPQIISYTVTINPGNRIITDSGTNIYNNYINILVPDLNEDVSYIFSIIATNLFGNSQPSQKLYNFIPDDVPSAIQLSYISVSIYNTKITININTSSIRRCRQHPPCKPWPSKITISTNSDGTIRSITQDFTNTSFIFIGLTNGIPYTFSITASNAAGDSSPTIVGPYIPATVPSPPVIQTLTPGNGQVTITMQPCETTNCNGGSSITSYTATSSPGGIIISGTSPLTVTGLTNGISYTFSVVATNNVGNSDPTISASVTPINSSLPSPPTALSGVGGDQALYILFTPGTDGGSPITNYEYSIDSGETFTPFDPPQIYSPVEIRNSSIQNGQSYTVLLKAVNTAGSSDASTSVTVTPTVNNLLSTNRLIRL